MGGSGGLPSTSSPPSDAPTPSSSAVDPSPTLGTTTAAPSAELVLRFDFGPDYSSGDLTGLLFMPGPEFSLYADGTVIYRDDRAASPPLEGPIHRATPFSVASLGPGEVQRLLDFALVDGGLASARERYDADPNVADGFGYAVFVVRDSGVQKRVEVVGPLVDQNEGPDGPARDAMAHLAEGLRSFRPPDGIATQDWNPGRYWGVLEAAQLLVDEGLFPSLPADGPAAWPWPDLTPTDFVYRQDQFYVLSGEPNAPGDARRVMSGAEAAKLDLSNNGGVVQGIYVNGPDGELYWFSMWPMLPDEPG